MHVIDMYAGRTVECKLPTGGSVCLVCDMQVVCGFDYEAHCPEF